MKIAILVGDGMGDYELPELGGKTVLQAARIPTMRRIAGAGRVLGIRTIPDECSSGSDVANLGLMGYDARRFYTGRAPIEAAGAEIPMGPEDVAFRCNLVTVTEGRMADYSAGQISTAEAGEIMDTLHRELGGESLRFHAGVGYRHLLIWRNGPATLKIEPPHEFTGRRTADFAPRGERAEEALRLMDASVAILRDHPVTRRRLRRGETPATQIWLWGQGRSLRLDSYLSLHGLRGGVVSSVDLVRGLGRLAGLEAPRIPGSTGFLDTDTRAEVRAARAILSRGDFLFFHFEAPDECGHMGSVGKKIQAVEMFDREIVAPVWDFLEQRKEPYRLIVTTDHRTPCSTRGHTREPVPLAIVEGPLASAADSEAPFDETITRGAADPAAHDAIREALVTCPPWRNPPEAGASCP